MFLRLRFIGVLLLMIVPTWGVAQSVQRGEVLEYRGTDPKTPLAKVNVVASNAGAVQSDAEGQFSLQFRTLHSGDAIQFRRIERSGYEVMNTEALEVARVARPSAQDEASDRIRIVMIPRATLQRLRDGYRNVTEQRYEQQLQRAEAQLDSLRQAGKLAEEQYNARINALEEAHEEKLNQLDTYIDKFARIDLSDISQDEQRIVALVQEGRFEEALQIYEDQHLSERLQQNRADVTQLTAIRDQLAEAARQKAIENERLRQSIDRQVTLLCMAGGEDNLMRAHQLLHQTYLADTTYWQARREYAFSLRNHGMYAEMEALLRAGIQTEADAYGRGMMSMELMMGYWQWEKYEAAYRTAQWTDSVMTPLQQSNYAVLSRALPSWSEYKLLYLLREGRLQECQPIAERLEAQWSPDTLSASSLYDYISVASVLSDYYSGVGQNDRAVWCAEQSMYLGTYFERLMPWETVAIDAYVNVCYTLMAAGRMDEAWRAVRRSVPLIADRVAKAGTISAYGFAVNSYYVMAEALVAGGQYVLADSIMQSAPARTAFDKVEETEKPLMQMVVAFYHYYEARVWLAKGLEEEAERYGLASLNRLATLPDCEGVTEYLLPDFMARIHLSHDEYDEAIEQCQQAIAVNKAAWQETQDEWEADNLCRSYILLAEIYQAAGRKGKCTKALKQAKAVAPFECNRIAIAAVEAAR